MTQLETVSFDMFGNYQAWNSTVQTLPEEIDKTECNLRDQGFEVTRWGNSLDARYKIHGVVRVMVHAR